MKYLVYIIIKLLLVLVVVQLLYCRSASVEEKHGYGDECKHCHGEKLQGVQNIKENCGECHNPLKMKPEEMKSKERIDAVFNGAHPHKTDNMFKGTPSCFYCHRRMDF